MSGVDEADPFSVPVKDLRVGHHAEIIFVHAGAGFQGVGLELLELRVKAVGCVASAGQDSDDHQKQDGLDESQDPPQDRMPSFFSFFL